MNCPALEPPAPRGDRPNPLCRFALVRGTPSSDARPASELQAPRNRRDSTAQTDGPPSGRRWRGARSRPQNRLVWLLEHVDDGAGAAPAASTPSVAQGPARPPRTLGGALGLASELVKSGWEKVSRQPPPPTVRSTLNAEGRRKCRYTARPALRRTLAAPSPRLLRNAGAGFFPERGPGRRSPALSRRNGG